MAPYGAMDRCPTVPSHCHSPESNSTWNPHEKNQYNAFENDTFKINPTTQRTVSQNKSPCPSVFWPCHPLHLQHYSDVIMGAKVSQITSLTTVYSSGYSGTDRGKHQSFALLAFVRRICWWRPVTRKLVPFDAVIMKFNLIHKRVWS